MSRTDDRSSRRITIAGVLIALLALVAASAFAFGPRHGRGHPMSGEMQAFIVNKMLDRADATDAQRDQILTIMDEATREVETLREGYSRHDLHARMVELLTAETIDPTAIDALRFEHEQVLRAVMARMTEAVVDSAALLSREQRVAIADGMRERFGRFGRGHIDASE